MAKSSGSLKGWLSVFLIAAALSLFFWYGQQMVAFGPTKLAQPSRVFTAEVSEPRLSKEFPRATEAATQEHTLVPKDIAWAAYRARPTTSIAAFVEPSAQVVLLAPQPEQSHDEWLAQLRSRHADQRGLLVSTTADDQTNEFQQVGLRRQNKASKDWVRPQYVASSLNLNHIWPMPRKLLDQLRQLEQADAAQHNTYLVSSSSPSAVDDGVVRASVRSSQLSDWIGQARTQLNVLASADQLSNAADALTVLDSLADEMLQSSVAWDDSQTGELVARTAYSMKRRTSLWNGVLNCLHVQNPLQLDEKISFSNEQLREYIQHIRRDSQLTGDVTGWNTYLILDRLTSVAAGDQLQNDDVATVRKFLDRVSWSGVTETQRMFLDSESVRRVAEYIQPLAVSPIDYRTLLNDFEVYEDEPLHRCSHTIVSALEALQYSNSPQQTQLGQIINAYYRNANVRFAVSDELINRLIPPPQHTVRPVRQRILGANTTGGSQISSDLKVAVIPNASAWHVKLMLAADVSSRTASAKGPAVVHNTSLMKVNSDREIIISQNGIEVLTNAATVQSRDKVNRVETDYDGIPFIADMVHYFVDRELQAQRPIARKITQRMVAQETDQEFDNQLETQLQSADKQLDERLKSPLNFLGIDSDVVDLRSTENRLIGRYRIATHDTLAAHTPRPQAPSDSVFSMQLHQSAFNNACNQLNLGSRDWKLEELVTELTRKLNLELVFDQQDLPPNAIVRFEQVNPLSLEFADDQVTLTLRVAKLSEPGQLDLNHFIIRVNYECVVDGLSAELVRSGAVSVDGERLGIRDRLPLRAIFGRIFATHSKINLVDEKTAADERLSGLAISQLVTREGWLAIAVSPATSPHVAVLIQKQSGDTESVLR